ncbi:MAG TPA: OB-fold nucleic acid binding domain-containing protein, partial [Rhodothermales bacterium]|nr:OB-fold nucleic acid binding domain-containing protein [Rhodothermales bacterium]
MSRELTDQEVQRHQSRTWLLENGFQPYGYAWDVTHQATEIPALFDAAYPEGTEEDPAEARKVKVSVAGRMMTQRIMGKAAFFNLHDETGKIQVYIRRDDLPEGYYNEVFKKRYDLGDIVGVSGFVFRTKTGELSIHAERLELLTKTLRPLPIVKETEEKSYGGLEDKELRYRQRYADLAIHPEVREVFRKRSQLISAMRRFLDANGCLEVETPALQPIYGGAAARPFTTHHNALDMQLFMRISDELYLK